MIIQEYDCPTRYRVKSSSDKDVEFYIVDLKENACSCKNHMCVQYPKRKRGESVENTRCKHLQACRNYLLDRVLEKL